MIVLKFYVISNFQLANINWSHVFWTCSWLFWTWSYVTWFWFFWTWSLVFWTWSYGFWTCSWGFWTWSYGFWTCSWGFWTWSYGFWTWSWVFLTWSYGFWLVLTFLKLLTWSWLCLKLKWCRRRQICGKVQCLPMTQWEAVQIQWRGSMLSQRVPEMALNFPSHILGYWRNDFKN